MSITIPADKLLGLLGPNGEHWVKGTWGDDQSLCLHGAIRRCAPQPGDAYLVEKVANRQGWGVPWNDDESTTWADVRARIEHVEVTDTDLADTFGPQWEHVVALVRRAAVLTADEAKRLRVVDTTAYTAYAATVYTAAHTAYDAAYDAAYAAAAAASPARLAAAAYARLAAAAARALAVRHLIGDTFTQAHYDLLTRAWRTVIGPVHPDDKAVDA